jgi:DNA-binding winged helix-turn-helix (wHTH) protein
MHDASYSFGPFRLDPEDRRLTRGGEPVELNARYFDALLLMIATPGRLVSKDRFHDEVWRGIPVTDEALTQCIRTLRRALDDDAAAPKYIETVPRHGYRFIAQIEAGGDAIAPAAASARYPALLDAVAAAFGGAIAGIVAALLYVTAGLVTPGIGAASTLLVLVSINLLLGLAAGAAVGIGVAVAASRAGRASAWAIAGGALGGLVIGAVAHMLGNDLFELLFGRSPGAITGAFEGALLGAAVGLGTFLSVRLDDRGTPYQLLPAFAVGGVAGLGIPLLGGRLMAGSLAELAANFPDSRLRLGRFGSLFGETGFGETSLLAATALEGALFAGGAVTAIVIARRFYRPS